MDYLSVANSASHHFNISDIVNRPIEILAIGIIGTICDVREDRQNTSVPIYKPAK
jgi:hypothetical protein